MDEPDEAGDDDARIYIHRGLGLLSVAAIAGIVHLAARPDEPRMFGETNAIGDTLATLGGGFAVLFALIGLVSLARGLLRN